jgi:alginate O-acetyltransferase complex protein AlgI
MSLSNWLRDYLYIPLGGNKGGSVGSISVTRYHHPGDCRSGGIMDGACCFSAIIMAVCIVLAQFISSFATWVTTNLNLMITMVIGGLWHGASWNFIIWGALNGFALGLL